MRLIWRKVTLNVYSDDDISTNGPVTPIVEPISFIEPINMVTNIEIVNSTAIDNQNIVNQLIYNLDQLNYYDDNGKTYVQL